MSKLYTEEQVKVLISALNDIKNWNEELEDEWEDCGYRAIDALNKFSDEDEIELPSDDEVKEYSDRYSTMHEDVSDKLGKYLVSAIHIDGANWMKGQLYDGVRLKRFIKDEAEQILNQNK